MKRIAVAGILLMFAGVANAADYAITKVNEGKTRAVVKDNSSTLLSVGDVLVHVNEFAEECVGRVVKVEGSESVIVDFSECKDRSDLKAGLTLKKGGAMKASPPPTSPYSTEKSTGGLPSANEDWYTLWGIGGANAKYSDDELNDTLNDLEDQPGVDRSSVNLDAFGFYWPRAGHTAMHGFIANAITDQLEGDGGTYTISQLLYSYSYHQFFGANIGDGWFLRGDVGLARYVVVSDTILYDDEDVSKWGFGVLGGGGYAWPIGVETRMLLGGYITRRSADGESATSFNTTLSFLF